MNFNAADSPLTGLGLHDFIPCCFSAQLIFHPLEGLQEAVEVYNSWYIQIFFSITC